MTAGEGPHLLARERRDLDAVAEPLREGRRVAAFLVCPAELRSPVLEHLTERSGRAIPEPVEVTDAGQMLALLGEAASAGEGEIRSLAIGPAEDVVRALNWHREKLRRGASVLVWMADVDVLRVVRRLAPDAYSFRDTLVAVEGEKAFPVVMPDAGHSSVEVARLRYRLARTPLERAVAGRRLASELWIRDTTDDALRILSETLATLPASEISTDEGAVEAALLHWETAAVLDYEARLVESRRHLTDGLAILRRFDGQEALEARLALSAWLASPLGPDHQSVLRALEEARASTVGDWVRETLLFFAAESHAERGDLRAAATLFREALILTGLRPHNRAAALRQQGRLAVRAGRVADVELLLREAAEMWSSEGAGNELVVRDLAKHHALQSEIAAARRMLAELAGEDAQGRTAVQLLARGDLRALMVDCGAVREGLAGIRTALEDSLSSRRDGTLYDLASTYADCLVAAHEAGHLAPADLLEADGALLNAQSVSCSLSGEDPPWYHALYPLLRGRLLALLPDRASEAIEMTRTALALCEHRWRDAAPLCARTLAEHLAKAGRFEESLSVVERATPQLVQERFLEELARARATKLACLAHLGAPASETDATMTALRATFGEMDAPRITAETLLGLGLLLPATEAPVDALPLLEEAQELFAEMPIVALEARCLEAAGDVLRARGDLDTACGRYRAALGILERHDLGLRVPLLAKKLDPCRVHVGNVRQPTNGLTS